jgi:NADH:ubiquinone oxidoreductase subunit 3 (subunit A)
LIVVVIVVVVAIVVVVFVVVVLGGKKRIKRNPQKKCKNRYLHGTAFRSKHATDFVPRYWYVEPKNQLK